MSLLLGAALGTAALGGGMSIADTLFGSSSGGGLQQTFTPLPYYGEKSYINPMLWGALQQQLKGKPTESDWMGYNALMQQIRQSYDQSMKAWGSNLAGRGLYDSGITAQKKSGLASGRAGQEANAYAQVLQNALMRQLQAQQLTGGYLAGQRAGSGTYTWKE